MLPANIKKLAREWIAAWNSHDLDRIMAHYAEDIQFNSPVITQLLGKIDGQINDKAALRAYFTKGLKYYPNLRFELLHILVGVDSITLIYNGVRGLSAEVMRLNSDGRVCEVLAHYKN